MACATARSRIKSSSVPCLQKNFVLGSINSEEKWFLSRGGASDYKLTEGVSSGGAVLSRDAHVY